MVIKEQKPCAHIIRYVFILGYATLYIKRLSLTLIQCLNFEFVEEKETKRDGKIKLNDKDVKFKFILIRKKRKK